MLFGKGLPQDNPKKREGLKKRIETEGGLEKNDMKAMVIAAFLILFPAAVLILLAICFIAMLPVWLG